MQRAVEGTKERQEDRVSCNGMKRQGMVIHRGHEGKERTEDERRAAMAIDTQEMDTKGSGCGRSSGTESKGTTAATTTITIHKHNIAKEQQQ